MVYFWTELLVYFSAEISILHTYQEWDIKPIIVRGSLEQRLERIIELLNLPQQMSIKKAIELSLRDKVNLFDNVRLEA